MPDLIIPRSESGCSPGVQELEVPGTAADNQVVHARGFGSTDEKVSGIEAATLMISLRDVAVYF